MLAIEKIDTDDKSQARRFVEFYYKLYEGCPRDCSTVGKKSG
jgi:hypothetical protein